MNFPHRWLTDQLAIAGQLSPHQLGEIHEAGFKTLICNRPDFEGGPSQPTAAELQLAAESLGLKFCCLPVSPAGGTPEEAMKMGELMSQMPTPILAYCASGGRCMGLISLAAQLGQPIPGADQ
ncbi:MAG: hypothetical protein RL483_468 [Pseudomonadota bacterium]|jgi:uncharacterized protein (TIGR01244 family)